VLKGWRGSVLPPRPGSVHPPLDTYTPGPESSKDPPGPALAERDELVTDEPERLRFVLEGVEHLEEASALGGALGVALLGVAEGPQRVGVAVREDRTLGPGRVAALGGA